MLVGKAVVVAVVRMEARTRNVEVWQLRLLHCTGADVVAPECRLDLLGIFVVGIEERCAQTLYLIRHTKILTYPGGTSSLLKLCLI